MPADSAGAASEDPSGEGGFEAFETFEGEGSKGGGGRGGALKGGRLRKLRRVRTKASKASKVRRKASKASKGEDDEKFQHTMVVAKLESLRLSMLISIPCKQHSNARLNAAITQQLCFACLVS